MAKIPGETAPGQLAALFEKAWNNGDAPPDLMTFLSAHPPATLRDRAEVVRVDQKLRWKSGHPRSLEEYFALFPDLEANPKVKLALVVAEFRTAHRHGQKLDPARFAARFPDLPGLLDQLVLTPGHGQAEPAQKLPVAPPVVPATPGTGRVTAAAQAPAAKPVAATLPDDSPITIAPPSSGTNYDLDQLLDEPESQLMIPSKLSAADLIEAIQSVPEPPRRLVAPVPEDASSAAPSSSEQPTRQKWVARRFQKHARRYDQDPCLRTMPWFWDWILYRLFTTRATWTRRQREMMRSAIPLNATCILALALATVGVAQGIHWLRSRAESTGPLGIDLLRSRPDTTKEISLTPTEVADADVMHNYAIMLQHAQSRLAEGEFDKAARVLDSLEEQLRNWEWRHLRSACHPAPNVVTRTFQEVGAPAPDGDRLLTAGSNRILDTGDGHVVKELNTITVINFNRVAWNPDGQSYVTLDQENRLRVWDAATNAPRGEGRKLSEHILETTFSPNGARMITTGMTVAEMYIDDPERGPDKQALKFSVWDPAHPDAPLITLQGLYHRFGGPVVLSPDGTRFAGGTLHQTVRIYDTDSGSALTELKGHSMNARRIVFSPDNRYLVSSADNAMEKYVPTGEIKIWDLHTEAAIRDLSGHANVHSVSPDGSLVFAHDLSWMGRSKDRHRMKVWELATGKLRYELDDVIGSPAFTADGLRFAALYEGGVGVYETTTGTLLLKLPAPRTG